MGTDNALEGLFDNRSLAEIDAEIEKIDAKLITKGLSPVEGVEALMKIATGEKNSGDFLKACKHAAQTRESDTPPNTDVVITDHILAAKINAAKSGEFTAKGCVGQKWSKLPNTNEFKLRYNSMHDPASKKDVKVAWALETFEYCNVEKTHQRSWHVVDETLGEYFTLGPLVCNFGGWEWPEALVAAKTHASKCALLGGKWIVYDDMSEMVHFLKLKVIHREIMDNKWGRLTTWHNSGSTNCPQPVADAASGSADAIVPAKKFPAGKLNPGGQSNKRSSPTAKSGDAPPAKASKARGIKAEPKVAEDATKEAAKVKLTMAMVFEKAARLVKEIPRLDMYKFVRIKPYTILLVIINFESKWPRNY